MRTEQTRAALAIRGAAVLTLLASFATGALAQGDAVVEGTVKNAVSGAPVAGATVRVVGAYTAHTTNASGRYRVTVTPGASALRIVAIGFAPASRDVSVTPGTVVTIDVSLWPAATPLDVVVTTGTRTTGRTQATSPVPVDVVTARELERTGAVETWQQLQRLLPSVNAPRIPLGDNHLRPVTLRGLDPHHTLVLIDGKRRHPAATLLAGPSVPNRSFTDLATIPAAAIDRIEVLRDGAAAQYGSDAIAGVVNVVLKTGDPREVRVTAGEVYSAEGGRTFHDGRTVDASAAYGVVTPAGGYATASAQVLDRGGTNRAYPDRRQQYFPGDPRNDAPALVTSQFGDGSVHDVAAMINGALPLSSRVELYAFGDVSQRTGTTPDAFFRRPLDPRTVRAIYPDGFLPVVESRLGDASALVGVRGQAGRWRWDLSSVRGRNRVSYAVSSSENASLGVASPTAFYAGRVSAQQWTSTFDVSRDARLRSIPLTLSGGAEYREESFRIEAGDADSWRDGGVPIADGPLAGQPAAAGAQGLTGFRPLDEVAPQRSNTAAYVEAESRVTKRLLLDGAGRVERYSDFGSTANAKVAARVELLSGIAVRGAVSTGFRAPALMQEYLARTSTTARVSGGVTTFVLVRNFPVNSPEARLMGATPLRAERSANRSAGVVLDLPWLAFVTADYYRIAIRDRIGSTGTTADTAIIRLFQENGFRGIGGGGYFTNAWDTRTSGLDLTATRSVHLGNAGALQMVAGVNHTTTTITRIAELPAPLASVGRELLSRTTRGIIEQGQPRETITAALDFTQGALGAGVDGRRSGPTAQLDATDPAGDQVVPAKWITDARVSYRIRPRLTVAVSAQNLFDVYPVEWFDFKEGLDAKGFSMQGIFPYPGALSPFGMNGRTLSVQLVYR